MALTIAVIVCAYNEARLLPGCLHSLLAQTRPADLIIVVNNASSDDTRTVAESIAGVTVIDEPRKGLVVARETARCHVRADVLAYIDADCCAPITWLERVEARFSSDVAPVAVTGPYRFYDWDRVGRTIIALYDRLVAPPTHAALHRLLGIGAILYGGIEFHGEDTNLGRRLGGIGRVDLCRDCWVWTSARRYRAMGKGAVFRLYVRNFWSEIVHHRPADREHLDVRV